MNKFIQSLIDKKLDEMYNPNLVAPEYSEDWIRRLIQARRFDPFNIEDEPETFLSKLHRFVHEEDDEVEIEYENGESITLDVEVAKMVMAYANAEEIEIAGRNPEFMKHLLHRLDAEVVDLKHCGHSEEECDCDIDAKFIHKNSAEVK